jgi:phospholipid-translocating ATPase
VVDCAEDAVRIPPLSATNAFLTQISRVLETHTKSLTNAHALFLSIGGWFLWNIILSSLYKSPSTIYYVRNTFLRGFGASVMWWACLVIILASTIVFEIGVQATRKIFWETDVDVFQQLEKDRVWKGRFEEAAAGELQQGWARGTKKQDGKVERDETVDDERRREEQRREREVKDLLRNRVDEEMVDGGDVDRVLSRGFGDVRHT